MHAQLPKPFAMHPLLSATPSHRAKPKGMGRPAVHLPSQANLSFIFHSPPSEVEELSLLQKTLPTLKSRAESECRTFQHTWHVLAQLPAAEGEAPHGKHSAIWTTGRFGNKLFP